MRVFLRPHFYNLLNKFSKYFTFRLSKCLTDGLVFIKLDSSVKQLNDAKGSSWNGSAKAGLVRADRSRSGIAISL
jgi:hypothetical protein